MPLIRLNFYMNILKKNYVCKELMMTILNKIKSATIFQWDIRQYLCVKYDNSKIKWTKVCSFEEMKHILIRPFTRPFRWHELIIIVVF
jgi:hypothetical protein